MYGGLFREETVKTQFRFKEIHQFLTKIITSFFLSIRSTYLIG